MAMGDGTHKLPIKADVRKRIGKEVGDTWFLNPSHIDVSIRCEDDPRLQSSSARLTGCKNLRASGARQTGRRFMPPLTAVPISKGMEPRT